MARVSYVRQVVKINHDLVDLAICQLLHHDLVLRLRTALGSLLLLAPGLRLIILIHKVVVIVADIIFVDRHISNGMCEGLFRRGLEIFEEGLESSWRMSVFN